jgi:D-alanyl-D-alanine dipeptidase
MMKILLFFILMFVFVNESLALPIGFVYLRDIDPTIIQDMHYATSQNFVGRPIAGYATGTCILTRPAALALHHLQQRLRSEDLGLKVFDCYRPQMAVDEFIAWSQDAHDQKMKFYNYPHVNKADLFQLNYIAHKSGHTRGSTVDLTLVHFTTNGVVQDVFMGTHFDYLDPAAHFDATNVPLVAQENRAALRTAMVEAGFVPIESEWWHFTLRNEPYPNTYFNFPVQ